MLTVFIVVAASSGALAAASQLAGLLSLVFAVRGRQAT